MLKNLKTLFVRNTMNKAGSECLELLDNGFFFTRNSIKIAKVQWLDIKEVVVFKRDLVTTDLVCLEIITSAGIVYEFNEDVPGFEVWIDEMQRSLPGFDSSWRERVIKPAFATNRTVVFSDDKYVEKP